jgi:xanthine/uracil permease
MKISSLLNLRRAFIAFVCFEALVTFIFWLRPEPIVRGASWVFRELVPNSYRTAELIFLSAEYSLTMSAVLLLLMYLRSRPTVRRSGWGSHILLTLLLAGIAAYVYSFVWYYIETTPKTPIWDSSAYCGTGYLVAMRQDGLRGAFFVGLSQGLFKLVLAVIWWRNTTRKPAFTPVL